MKEINEYFNISILLCKKRLELLTEEEEILLQKWRVQSPENEKTYLRLTSELNIQDKQQQYKDIDASSVWKSIQAQIKSNKGKHSRLFPIFLRYAAAILLPLVIGSFLVFQMMHPSEKYSDLKIDQITPGTNKATLVLADGSKINLEQQKDTLINGQVLNQNNKLTYIANLTKNKSIKHSWQKLIVPTGGEYQLQLADGTNVWLNSNSELKYTGSFTGKERIVYLKGEAYFEVSEDKDHPFIVKTSTMDIAVLGTKFNIMCYDDDKITHTTLVEGSVGIDLKNESEFIQSAMLKPGMQAEYIRGDKTGTFKTVNTSLYTGWKNGKFQFNNEELGIITRKLARWYGVEFSFQDRSLQKIKFTGEMKRFEEFSTILKLLEFGSNMEFDVNGRVVTVKSSIKEH